VEVVEKVRKLLMQYLKDIDICRLALEGPQERSFPSGDLRPTLPQIALLGMFPAPQMAFLPQVEPPVPYLPRPFTAHILQLQ
jgi:hypothetical protein